nr:uncharacterized protein LOC112746897 isoform X1 [Arachis hypogaea]
MHVLFCDSDNFFRSKFILPKEGKEWVMTGVQEAWKGYKTRIKGKHFEIYNNIEVILKNRPLDIPEVQFRKLITYWSIPSVKDKLKSRQEARDTTEKAFTIVFSKKQPGRVRCYGRTITKTSLQKEREIAKIKQ